MKAILIILTVLISISGFAEGKKDFIEKKWFMDNNTFVIICKGWPKEGLAGESKVASAKEAALMNAQFTVKDLFNKPVDPVTNGTVEKYKIYDDYVTIQYIIKFVGLKNYYKGPK